MITTPNPYLDYFFSFLKRSGNAGWVYLLAYEENNYTVLQYDTDNKYLMQDMAFLLSLPRQCLYGQVAEQWWQLLNELELVDAHASAAEADSAPSSNSSVAAGRQVKLEPEAENKLFLYLEQILMGACPSRVQCCQHLDELSRIAHAFTQALNDRMQQAVADSLSERTDLAAHPPIALLNVWPWGEVIGRYEDYKFADGVVVSNVQESHRRPFQFAGIWVELPDSKKLELPVQFGFTDSRQQPVAALNEAQSRQLTTQWCLEQGYKQLVLDPQLRQVVEAYGVVDAAQPTRRWLSGGQLLVDLVQYHAQMHQRSAPQSMGESPEDDCELPWDKMEYLSLITDTDYELPS